MLRSPQQARFLHASRLLQVGGACSRDVRPPLNDSQTNKQGAHPSCNNPIHPAGLHLCQPYHPTYLHSHLWCGAGRQPGPAQASSAAATATMGVWGWIISHTASSPTKLVMFGGVTLAATYALGSMFSYFTTPAEAARTKQRQKEMDSMPYDQRVRSGRRPWHGGLAWWPGLAWG